MSIDQHSKACERGSGVGTGRTRRRVRAVTRCVVGVLALALLASAFPRRSAANIIYVTTLKDEIGGTDGCSLDDAIFSSKFHLNVAISYYNDFSDIPQIVSTLCVPGSGDDVIVLPPGQVLPLDVPVEDADNATGPSATPQITSNVTIEGYGATLQFVPVEGQWHAEAYSNASTVRAFRAFSVASTGHLTIHNLRITGFVTQGGYGGGGGGGGGMGAGGAIYVQGGALDVNNSTLDANKATGGNGSSGHGGGGGGLNGYGGPASCKDVYSEPLSFAGGGGGATGDGTGSCSGNGGGTVFDGDAGAGPGFDCGGTSGYVDGSTSGYDAPCPGGGGGGAIQTEFSSGNGGKGSYGGAGGGGACGGGNGGSGGFGGGGGAGCEGLLGSAGGDGGFGGGGGAGPNGTVTSGNAGHAGTFGGSASHTNGGGGAGLGGAIFSDAGDVSIENSTLTGNVSLGGRKANPSDTAAGTGEGHGGAIFSRNGSLTILNSTIDGNLSSGSGGGVYFYQDPTSPTIAFILRNTIIANSGGSDDAAAKQCTMNASIITGGDWRGNLIQNDDPSAPCDYSPPTGTVATGDPQLAPLQPNGGYTPTMAITESSPAWNAADASDSLLIDQRGSQRPELGDYDIGAYELCTTGPASLCQQRITLCLHQESLTIQALPANGGTTSPAPGTTSQCQGTVVPILATANPGYTFTGWSGNALLPNNPSAEVVMLEPQNITANFAACNCVVDVSAYVTVKRGPYVLNLATGRFVQTVTVTNNSAFTITGPVSLVLESLSGNASLFNLTGTTDFAFPPAGSPYQDAPGNLGPGQMATYTLQFTDPTRTGISYNTRVLAGPGAR